MKYECFKNANLFQFAVNNKHTGEPYEPNKLSLFDHMGLSEIPDRNLKYKPVTFLIEPWNTNHYYQLAACCSTIK